MDLWIKVNNILVGAHLHTVYIYIYHLAPSMKHRIPSTENSYHETKQHCPDTVGNKGKPTGWGRKCGSLSLFNHVHGMKFQKRILKGNYFNTLRDITIRRQFIVVHHDQQINLKTNHVQAAAMSDYRLSTRQH